MNSSIPILNAAMADYYLNNCHQEEARLLFERLVCIDVSLVPFSIRLMQFLFRLRNGMVKQANEAFLKILDNISCSGWIKEIVVSHSLLGCELFSYSNVKC